MTSKLKTTSIIIYRVFRKNTAQRLQHHNFATVRYRVMRFSAKCSERNCKHDKDQCLNIAIKYFSVCSWPVNYLSKFCAVFFWNTLYINDDAAADDDVDKSMGSLANGLRTCRIILYSTDVALVLPVSHYRIAPPPEKSPPADNLPAKIRAPGGRPGGTNCYR